MSEYWSLFEDILFLLYLVTDTYYLVFLCENRKKKTIYVRDSRQLSADKDIYNKGVKKSKNKSSKKHVA
jgi:hypothetical protein